MIRRERQEQRVHGHPSYRYPERPKQKAACSPSVYELRAKTRENRPNSYAAVLAKNKPPEPEKFFIDLRSDLMTKITLEEELPVLGSPEQRLTIKGPDEKTKATSDRIEND